MGCDVWINPADIDLDYLNEKISELEIELRRLTAIRDRIKR